jgi:preprotein translocase subunit SecF
MEFFRIRRDIPFMRHALVFNIISLLTFLAAVFFLVTRGLDFSIEFTCGTSVQTTYAGTADLEHIRGVVNGLNYGDVQVQNYGTSHDVIIRVPTKPSIVQKDVPGRVFRALCAAESGSVSDADPTRPTCVDAAKAEPVVLKSSSLVGPSVGAELMRNGAYAMISVVIGIMLYLAFRFEWKFSIAAIVANLHDVVIILGFFAFFQWEFSLSVLAGVLAVLGYSVNESVVIFDRIRETFRRFRKLTTMQVIDHAITSTISRTIITHFCTQMMVLSMLVFGGPTLHYFAMALTIGICFGIYSSVFVAAAIAMWLGVKREDLVHGNVKSEIDPNDPNAGAVV